MFYYIFGLVLIQNVYFVYPSKFVPRTFQNNSKNENYERFEDYIMAYSVCKPAVMLGTQQLI